MEKLQKLIRSILSCFIAVLLVLGITPVTAAAAATYTLHLVDDLSNSDALYSEYAKTHNLKLGYITNLTSPVWNVMNSDFGTTTRGAITYLHTASNKLPTKNGRENAAVWANVASITYRNAGYYGDDKNNTFDIVFTLTRVAALKSNSSTPDTSALPYYTVALTDNTTGEISANSYVRTGDFSVPENRVGPYTIENWNIKITDSSGSRLDDVMIAQTYRDIDIVRESNDSSYASFNEGFYFVDGYADDTYVTRDNCLTIMDRDGKSNARYEAGPAGTGNLSIDDQRGWVVVALTGGEATLQWSGQICGSFIANSVNPNYPSPPDPVKSADKEIVKANDAIEFTVTENFPLVNPSNAAKGVTVRDRLDDHLLLAPGIRVTRDGKDVTDRWTVETEGQTVYIRANDPAGVEGLYKFTIPATVKDENLDKKTLIIRDGETYAEIPNKAYIVVKDQFDADIERETDLVIVLEKGSSIEVTKDADKSHIDGAGEGDEVRYAFAIQNTGKLTLHDVKLTDSLPIRDLKVDWKNSSDPATGEAVLSPGETVTATAAYDLTEADLAKGEVVNTVTVTGVDPKGGVVTDEDDAKTTLATEASISLSKTADPNRMTDPTVGDGICYNFVITNTGSVPLRNIIFQDDHELTDLTFSTDLEGAVLPAGGTITGRAVYHLTANDIDSGSVLNKADVTAVSPDGKTVSDKAQDTTVIETTPAILLTKTTPEAVLYGAVEGDEVLWQFTVKNIGKNTLSNVHIVDHLEGVGEIAYDWAASSDALTGDGVLAPGETVPAFAVYALTKEDIIAKNVANAATAHGTDPSGKEVTSDANAKLKLNYDSSLIIDKEADVTDYTGAKAGDVITYTLRLTNNGSVDLDRVELVDLKEGVTVGEYVWPTREGFLAVGETVTAKAYYTLTQDDIDITSLGNDAAGKGRAPDGTWVSVEIPNTITKEKKPEITLVKDVDINEISAAKAGDTLTYTVTVMNTGDVTLHDVDLRDSMDEVLYDVTVEAARQRGEAEGADTAQPEAPRIEGAEVDADEGAADELGDELQETTDADASEEAGEMMTEIPQMTVGENEAEEGFAAMLSFGPQTMAGESFAEEGFAAMAGFGPQTMAGESFAEEGFAAIASFGPQVAAGENVSEEGSDILQALPTKLAPGEGFVMTAKYDITQEDINRGKVVNVADVTAKDPDDEKVTDGDDAQTVLVQKSSDVVTKKADVTKIASTDVRVGYEIRYDFTAANTGNTTLHDVTFTDEMLEKAGRSITWEWKDKGVLLPGETIKGTAMYALTEKDLDAGRIVNVIIMNAKDPSGEPLKPSEAKAETIFEMAPAHTVTKTVDKELIEKAREGDTVNYSFTYRNSGNAAIYDIEFTDAMLTAAGVKIDWDWSKTKSRGEEAVLYPGEVITGKASYKITQADIDNGKISNAITANAKDHNDNPLDPATSEVTTKLVQISKLTVKKSVDKTSLSNPAVGTVLTYSFKITNEGSTTLTDIQLADSLTGHGLSDITYQYPDETKSLLPGKTMTASATYVLTQADINSKKVDNSVIAKGRDPLKKEITSERSSVTTTIISTVKPTASPSPVPTTSQTRYTTQTVTSPKTGDDAAGIVVSVMVLLVGSLILITRIRRRRSA